MVPAGRDQGKADAQFLMGFAYDTGEGAEQSDKEAVRWYSTGSQETFSPQKIDPP